MSGSVGAMDGAAAAGGGGSRSRRDHLIDLERMMQRLWRENKVFEADAVAGKEGTDGEKFFCTFPYPYMNGRLHLGHAFSLTKAEFQARFQRMLGKNVLWPFGLHCTGMPIAACADKLKRELSEDVRPTEKRTETVETSETNGVGTTDVDSFHSKKAKAAAKQGADPKSQFSIMESMGVPMEEIPKFSDPTHWLTYFPPLAQQDLQLFGLSVDWRRSFITTNVNPYYDVFIRWQFNLLKKLGKIKFGMRATVFSRVEHQACADHDRASGEGVTPQEYTLIKLTVQKVPDSWKKAITTEGVEKAVSLVAATLRPETMYGQTNCFVLPEGTYGLFLGFSAPRVEAFGESGVLENRLDRPAALRESDAVYICSERCAFNMAFQGLAPLSTSTPARPYCLMEVRGMELIGLPLSAPNSSYNTVYALPMTTILMDKGSGVVTSVPSDAPDDYAALMDLKNKAEYFRDKFGVQQEWVQPFDVVEIIDVPGFGKQAAVEACKRNKIKSQNDKAQLLLAKEEVYKKGFYEGVMLVGSQAGKKVADAKPVVREELINSGDALPYSEPEKKVVSRSGDDCIVALCNQWYLEYGETSWRTSVENHVTSENFRSFSSRTQHQLENVLSWLKEWACSRHYGLGTYLPWEIEKGNKVLIESLSDSTIYMAYYTIAHFLQGGAVDGSVTGPLGIKPAQLSDDVFNYIFTLSDSPPAETDIDLSALKMLRSEFEYWYPMDLRVSGKDLIFNHLTMALYNHAAVWKDRPNMWPRSYFCNGHVMVDAEKMSKSAGNFLTVHESVETYSADATRLALADAGDSLDDANFQRETANAAIMKLYLFEQFVSEMRGVVPGPSAAKDAKSGGAVGPSTGTLRTGSQSRIPADDMFENELGLLVEKAKQAYLAMCYRDALKACFFDFQTRRDQYRILCGDKEMHCDSIDIFIETQVKILSPICPHICEYIWTRILNRSTLIAKELWPSQARAVDATLHRQFSGLMSTVEDFRKLKEKALSVGSKKAAAKGAGSTGTNDGALKKAVVYVSKDYMEWQQVVLKQLQQIPLKDQLEPPSDFMNIIRNNSEIQGMDKNIKKQAMSFASYQMKEELPTRGLSALDLRLSFDELRLLVEQKEFLCRVLQFQDIEVLDASGAAHLADDTDNRNLAIPGKPALFVY